MLWGEDTLNHAIPTPAMTRNLCGEFFERATVHLLDGVRHKTDSNCDYCPDISAGGMYAECKSVGKNDSMIVYDGRAAKDAAFVSEGRKLFYFAWRHNADAYAAKDTRKLNELLASGSRGLVVIEFEKLHAILESRPVRKLNSKYTGDGNRRLGYGNNEKGYGYGWCLPTSAIREQCGEMLRLCGVNSGGVQLPYLRVWTTAGGAEFIRSRMGRGIFEAEGLFK